MFEFISAQHEASFNMARDTIYMLANSQGLYSRLLHDMIESEWEPLYDVTIEVCFKEPLDFIYYIEC